MPWITRNPKRCSIEKYGDQWRVKHIMIYHDLVTENVIYIQPGYVTDLASIPWFYRWRFKPDGPWWDESIIHDGTYGSEMFSRATCDEIFKHALFADNKVGKYRTHIFYNAVRIGGGFVWDNHTADTIAYARNYIYKIPAVDYFS